jgi:FkbM family methyltransferase
MPYFSKEPIVFDIGSNKGEFADLLIDNVSEIHLFEPNTDLLTYTRVKYCDRSNVSYIDLAAYKEDLVSIDFFYFTNENNGLSSIYDNPKWDELPKQKKKVESITIDTYTENYDIQEIDFIKIDVEGAEMDVLLGMEHTLIDKAVKYIQIEYSPHYKLNGYKFTDVIRFVNQYGYKVFSTDIEGLEITVDNFVEDYRLENFIIKNMEITEDWNGEFIKNTQGLKFDFALEIGAFEGLTSNYICDNLLNEGGRMIALDPLKEKYLTTDLSNEDKQMNKELSTMFKGQYGRFKRNTKGKPIELIRSTSREAFPDLQDFLFDFIYIDGDHRKDEVYNDGFECFKLLKIGGYMLFDDYEWRPETTEGINTFLNQFQGKYKVHIKSYQVLIEKTDL